MSLLTKEDVRAAGGIVHSDGNVFFTNLDQLNAAILAKLASAELPEPVMVMHKNLPAVGVFTTAQLTAWGNTRFAQGAASQLSAEPIYQYQMGDGSWIDQQRHSYYYNRLHAPNAVVRIVFTLKEPK